MSTMSTTPPCDLRRRAAVVGVTLWLAAVLSACSSMEVAQPGDDRASETPPQAAVSQAPAPAFEQRQRERALSLARQGRLADAALAWEVLTVLRPDSSEYRERLADINKQIDAEASERIQRAAAAHKRGELDNAIVLYLSALAVEPDNTQAADALRAIERDRNKRMYLGKFSRITLTRRATMEAEVAAAPRRLQQSSVDRNDLEHATMLVTQGELDTAIQLLEKHLASDRRDDAARQLLADVYYQKGEKLALRDKTAAIAVLEKCVRLDATHTRAAAMLKQLKGAGSNGASQGAAGAQRPATADPR